MTSSGVHQPRVVDYSSWQHYRMRPGVEASRVVVEPSPIDIPMTSNGVQQPRVVAGYYSSWAHYRKGVAKYRVEDIPAHLCTHLIYAYATLDPVTLLATPFDVKLDLDANNFKKCVQLKEEHPRLKVLLGLGGWRDSNPIDGPSAALSSNKYSRLVADKDKRRAFTDHIVQFLLLHGFDGLDLNWNGPGSQDSKDRDKEGFTAWLQDLRAALAPRGLLLTSAMPVTRWEIDRGYDFPKVAELLDLIFLLSYSYQGPWETRVAHHAPLKPQRGENVDFCVDFAVNYLKYKGAPAKKLVVGVPLFGHSWTLANCADSGPGALAKGMGRPGPYLKEDGILAYYECCLAIEEGWREERGDGGPYITLEDQWACYDDVESVVEKAQYVKEQGLAGVAVWDLPADDFSDLCGNGANPLLTAINNTLIDT